MLQSLTQANIFSWPQTDSIQDCLFYKYGDVVIFARRRLSRGEKRSDNKKSHLRALDHSLHKHANLDTNERNSKKAFCSPQTHSKYGLVLLLLHSVIHSDTPHGRPAFHRRGSSHHHANLHPSHNRVTMVAVHTPLTSRPLWRQSNRPSPDHHYHHINQGFWDHTVGQHLNTCSYVCKFDLQVCQANTLVLCETRITVYLPWTIFFVFSFLCPYCCVIEKYGWELSAVQRWASNFQYWKVMGEYAKLAKNGPLNTIFYFFGPAPLSGMYWS